MVVTCDDYVSYSQTQSHNMPVWRIVSIGSGPRLFSESWRWVTLYIPWCCPPTISCIRILVPRSWLKYQLHYVLQVHNTYILRVSVIKALHNWGPLSETRVSGRPQPANSTRRAVRHCCLYKQKLNVASRVYATAAGSMKAQLPQVLRDLQHYISDHRTLCRVWTLLQF